jgi:peptidoglycan/LPS O-acetylase OafA/YrhL
MPPETADSFRRDLLQPLHRQLPAFIFMSRWSHWFLHLPAGDFLETLAGCAVAIAMAELSWRYFESPFLKLKDQFTVRRASSSLRASLPASPACL